MGCDESFLALPAVAVMAGVIGNVAQIRRKSNWREPAILWAAIVAESGTRKSPPLAAVIAPLHSLNGFFASTYEEQRKCYESKLKDNRKRQRQAVKELNEFIPLPDEPIAERWMVGDLSFDQLALQLSRQWRGLIVCRDELDGWLSGFDMTRSSKGAGMANWLEFHGGRPMTIGRRGKNVDMLQIPYASVSVTGGIQPEILKQRFTKSHLASGLFARLLFAFPPASSRTWSEVEVSASVTSGWSNLLELIAYVNHDPNLQPKIMELAPDAKKRFAQFVNEFGKIQDNADELLAASFAKLEGYAARFALVLHLGRWADQQMRRQADQQADGSAGLGDDGQSMETCGQDGRRGQETRAEQRAPRTEQKEPRADQGVPIDPAVCELSDVENGIKLSLWFANETKRVQALLAESEKEKNQRKLINWVQRRGGMTTVRELVRNNKRRYSTVDLARTALTELVEAGHGRWEDREMNTPGRPMDRMFVLANCGSDEGSFVVHNAQNS